MKTAFFIALPLWTILLFVWFPFRIIYSFLYLSFFPKVMKRTKLSLEEFIQLVKKKKELSDLDSSVIQRFIQEWFKAHKDFETLSFSEQKMFLKEVRAKMRRTSGMFTSSDYNEETSIEDLLSKHKSTSERKEIYPEFINKLSALSPTSILDLGAGP